jgi:hypothetical protein
MMVLKFGWDFTVVLPVKDAITVAEIMSRALAWEEKYAAGETVYYAYPNQKEVSMKLVVDELVHMAKLAGKPEK